MDGSSRIDRIFLVLRIHRTQVTTVSRFFQNDRSASTRVVNLFARMHSNKMAQRMTWRRVLSIFLQYDVHLRMVTRYWQQRCAVNLQALPNTSLQLACRHRFMVCNCDFPSCVIPGLHRNTHTSPKTPRPVARRWVR